MQVWISDSLERILPESKPGSNRQLQLVGLLCQVISFQIGFRPVKNPAENAGPYKITLNGGFAKYCSVRLAGLVPLKDHSTFSPSNLLEGYAPGFVPDPLLESFEEERFEKNRSRSYWVTVRLPNQSGKNNIKVTIDDGTKKYSVEAIIRILPAKLPKLNIPVTHWFYSDAIADWYKVEPFGEEYWRLVEKYFKNLVDHNQNTIYTPLFTPPLDGKKRIIQLVGVIESVSGKYTFGWGRLRKWVKLAKACGFEYFEMTHLFSQWGAKYAINILVSKQKGGKLKPLCKKQTEGTGKVYRNFLQQFLPALIKFLKRENIFNKCIFHLSDEPEMPHIEQYRKAREMFRQIAPEIKITEALSSIEFHRQGLVDNPVPNIGALSDFIKNGVCTWTYYCCGPRLKFPNRFLDFPLYRLRILGLQMFRFELQGFLHWGGNYWYRHGTTELIDPYLVNDGAYWPVWFAGDTFVIYPGKNGPIDSLRWEVYRELFDDYRLLCLASQVVGKEQVMKLLTEIRMPDDYPQKADYIRHIRSSAIRLITKYL
ncbi:MAG: DUF4091 domain-containing protein [Sedimentisphaerales bacterium]